MQDMAAIIAAAVEAAMAAQATPAQDETSKSKPTRKGGKTRGGKTATTRKPKPTTDGYKPTAAKRREAATARQLWALNAAGLLTLDPDGGNDPVTFGPAFDCIAATRK